ncbi:sulfite exporter TauE/SafE family protein [Rhodopseudomonas palustris]|uniref:Probable membrane transporter protein n=1 Tax=Rhodopseudomonas palustris TaxID=1076 RepID=A0A418VLQ2_RHOPL|nr:sulfite exporter TauE/SafE family protein [Rhodopseudomonas palustris]RJF77039.1 sulfite exporter TauE/SafE family protein [Rhodopseudomonas palustris]
MQDLIAAAQASLASALPAPPLIAATLGAVMAAALLRGFTGFGFALAAVPLMGLFMTPAKAVPVAVLLQRLGGLNDLRRNHRDCHWPSLRWLIVGAVIGSPLGALALSVAPAPVARIVIAVIIAVAVLMLGRGFALAAVPSRLATAMVGLIAGLFNGLAAMPGPPAVVYYMSGPFRAVAARASMLVFFLATSIAAFISIALVGLATPAVIWLAVMALPVMFLGTWVGELGFRRGTEKLHRHISIASLAMIALISAAKGFSELM